MIIIGEKINATLSRVKTIILERDTEQLIALAQSQAEAGADFIDVNVGTGTGSAQDEQEAMTWAVENIQAHVEKPLCIDSADASVLDAGLAARSGRPSMINSTKAEEKSLQEIVPLAKKYDTDLVALAMDESGIPETVDKRLSACDKVVNACKQHGFPVEKLLFDPLVLPISTDNTQGRITLETVSGIKKAYPEAKTVMGLSNVSYGLPERKLINIAFLHMAIYAGLDAAIANPQNEEFMFGVKVAEAIAGRDRHCRKYSRAARKLSQKQ